MLAISAHWYINATAALATPIPRTIHDFYGFPQALFDVEYPARATRIWRRRSRDLVKPTWVGLDRDSWGLDHGTWSVLVHVFPEADVPVIQLSIDATKPPSYHLELGRRLGALRDQGVLILGSGNIVHNLGLVNFRQPDVAYDWATRFDADMQRYIANGDEQAMLDPHRIRRAAWRCRRWTLPPAPVRGWIAPNGRRRERAGGRGRSRLGLDDGSKARVRREASSCGACSMGTVEIGERTGRFRTGVEQPDVDEQGRSRSRPRTWR